MIARLVKMSGKLCLKNMMSNEDLLRLVHLCVKSELPWATHAMACLLQDILNVNKNQNAHMDIEPEPLQSTNWGGADVESICENFEIEENLIPIQSDNITKQGKFMMNGNMVVFESDDSEFEDMLDDILERGRSLLKKTPKAGLTVYSGSSAIDSRLDAGVEAQAEITLRRLVMLSTHNLSQNVSSSGMYEDNTREFPDWPMYASVSQPRPYSYKANISMMNECFDKLFEEVSTQSASNIEHILHLWLTLNCPVAGERFNPATIPTIALNHESIQRLISAVAWNPGLSLRAWCYTLQTLTLASNQINAANDYGVYATANHIVNHPDFVQLLLRLLSGAGVVHLDKGLVSNFPSKLFSIITHNIFLKAGPSVCKALQDFMVRILMRCDVVSPSSITGNYLKSLLLKVIYQLVQPTGPLAARHGPLDTQCKLLQSMLYLDYTNADLSITISILESTGKNIEFIE